MKLLIRITYPLVLGLVVFITSCKEEDPEPVEITEQNAKEKLEDNGIELTNEMESMKDSKSGDAAKCLDDLFKIDDIDGRTASPLSEIAPFIKVIADYSDDKLSFKEFSRSLRVAGEYVNLQSEYQNITGVYTWNSETESWDEDKGGDKIIIEFPTCDASSNNATFTVQKFVTVDIKNQDNKDNLEAEDLPSEFLADLVIDDTKEMEFSFNVSYDADDFPTSISYELFLNPFTYNYSFSNNGSKATLAQSLKKNDEVLIDMSYEMTGDLDYNKLSDDLENDDISSLDLESAKLSYQVMDFKVEGSVTDINKFIDDLQTLEEGQGDPGYDFETAADDMEALLNDHVTIEAFFLDSNEKFETEFVVVVESDEFNPDDKYLDTSLVLVFKDGTKVAIEDFFETGFEDLQDELESFFDSLEADFD